MLTVGKWVDPTFGSPCTRLSHRGHARTPLFCPLAQESVLALDTGSRFVYRGLSQSGRLSLERRLLKSKYCLFKSYSTPYFKSIKITYFRQFLVYSLKKHSQKKKHEEFNYFRSVVLESYFRPLPLSL